MECCPRTHHTLPWWFLFFTQVYERAVANLPPGPEKRYWQRYIYLWIKYALWEELDTNEPARAREVYRAALKLVPHGNFTFAKLWIMAAKFEVRQKRVDSARKILGMGIGMAPKERLFKSYIELEGQLGNVDRYGCSQGLFKGIGFGQ